MCRFYTSVERYGNNILWSGYENGVRFNRKVKFKPSLYITTKDEESEFKSLIGEIPLKRKSFESLNEASDFVEKYKDVSGIEIFGNTNWVTQFIQEKYPSKIDYDLSLINICSYDIEVDISDGYANVDEADKTITSISYKSSKTSTYHLLALKDYDKCKTITDIPVEDIMFEKFDSEKLLLKRFMQIWTYDYPDIITGWNVEYFDIMYTVTRIKRVLGEELAKRLSPWGILKKKTKKIFNRDQSTYAIYGVGVIDSMEAFKKFGYKYLPQESFKLDHISYVVLGEKKVDYNSMGYKSLTDLYDRNPQLYLDYSLKDTYLVQRIEDETGLVALVIAVAYRGGVNYYDAFGTVGIWESILYRWQMERNLVPHIKGGPGDDMEDLLGGYVKEPVTGFHKWTVSGDLNSLYPSLMLEFNMSPETYLENMRQHVTQDMVLKHEYKNTNKDIAICANGVAFDRSKKGMIPTIIGEYYSERRSIKNNMLSAESELEDIKKEMKKRGLAI